MQKWKVLWKDWEGKRRKKLIDGPKPTEAVKFAKSLKREGLSPDVISAGHAFPPTQKQEVNRRPGTLWCPYCLKFRAFKFIRIKKSTYITGADLRCPTCWISTNHYWVKKYNGLFYMTEAEIIKRFFDMKAVRDG